jgi:hypothetical protein
MTKAIMHPKVGVEFDGMGMIKFGMTLEEVEAVVGKLELDPTESHGQQVVFCGFHSDPAFCCKFSVDAGLIMVTIPSCLPSYYVNSDLNLFSLCFSDLFWKINQSRLDNLYLGAHGAFSLKTWVNLGLDDHAGTHWEEDVPNAFKETAEYVALFGEGYLAIADDIQKLGESYLLNE